MIIGKEFQQSKILQNPNHNSPSDILAVNPLTNTQSSQNRPDDFGNTELTKTFSEKHLKEKCWSEAKQQLSFKYFEIFRFIP